MDRKAVSAIIAVGIWLAVVMVFCTMWIREGIKDAAVNNDALAAIASKLDDLRAARDGTPQDYFKSQRQSEQDLLNGPGWVLKDGKAVPAPK
jgi:hypothetical protein